MRVVMFRISEPEFEAIRTACESSGARSFSAFARNAVLSQTSAGAGADPVNELQSRVGRLEQSLQALHSILRPRQARVIASD